MARSVRLADYRKDGETERQHSQGELEKAAVSIAEAWCVQRSVNRQDHERSRRCLEVKTFSVTGYHIETSGCGSQRTRSQD
eukprot:7776551-Pyramimonas_sp.AAC.1